MYRIRIYSKKFADVLYGNLSYLLLMMLDVVFGKPHYFTLISAIIISIDPASL